MLSLNVNLLSLNFKFHNSINKTFLLAVKTFGWKRIVAGALFEMFLPISFHVKKFIIFSQFSLPVKI